MRSSSLPETIGDIFTHFNIQNFGGSVATFGDPVFKTLPASHPGPDLRIDDSLNQIPVRGVRAEIHEADVSHQCVTLRHPHSNIGNRVTSPSLEGI